MLDIKRIREKTDEVREGLRRRGADLALLDAVLELDRQRRALLGSAEEMKNRRNATSKEIGAARKRGEDTAAIQAEIRTLGDRITALDEQIRGVEAELHKAVLCIPNVPCATIPTGSDASANRVARVEGSRASSPSSPRTMWPSPRSWGSSTCRAPRA